MVFVSIYLMYMEFCETFFQVEKFKHNQQPHNSLHSMFNIHTGNTLPLNENWPHLQVFPIVYFVLTSRSRHKKWMLPTQEMYLVLHSAQVF